MTIGRWRGAGLLFLLLLGVGAPYLMAQSTINTRNEIWKFLNGIRVGSVQNLTGTPLVTFDANGVRVALVATETITAGAIITANACGGLKRITAAGAVTTSTVNTFTAPAAANAGCAMMVCNVGATNNITLDNNANFKSTGAADIVLTPDDCAGVVSDGVVWRSTGPLVAN